MKLSFLKDLENVMFRNSFSWIDVKLECSFVHCWILWNYCNAFSKLTKVNFTDINSIKVNISAFLLHDSREGIAQGTLSSASSSNDANFLTALNLE